MTNDRCNCGQILSEDKTQHRASFHHLANKCVLKRGKWDLYLESSRPNLKISEIQTLQHSGNDQSNGLGVWKKKPGKQLGIDTRTCAQLQVRILRIKIFTNQVPRAMFLHLLWQLRKRENALWTRELHFLSMSRERECFGVCLVRFCDGLKWF